MKRWPIMVSALAVWSLLPNQGKDLGQLRPAAVWMIQEDNHLVTVKTDTKDVGQGETLLGALQNMEDTAFGYLLYDTVEDLLVEERCEYLIPQAREVLRPNVRVCRIEEEIPLEGVWEYLRLHRPAAELSQIEDSKELQIIRYKKDRFSMEYQDG